MTKRAIQKIIDKSAANLSGENNQISEPTVSFKSICDKVEDLLDKAQKKKGPLAQEWSSLSSEEDDNLRADFEKARSSPEPINIHVQIPVKSSTLGHLPPKKIFLLEALCLLGAHNSAKYVVQSAWSGAEVLNVLNIKSKAEAQKEIVKELRKIIKSRGLTTEDFITGLETITKKEDSVLKQKLLDIISNWGLTSEDVSGTITFKGVAQTYKTSFLAFCCMLGARQTAVMLMDKGADLSDGSSNALPPIYFLSRYNKPENQKLLLDLLSRGADPTVLCHTGTSCQSNSNGFQKRTIAPSLGGVIELWVFHENYQALFLAKHLHDKTVSPLMRKVFKKLGTTDERQERFKVFFEQKELLLITKGRSKKSSTTMRI